MSYSNPDRRLILFPAHTWSGSETYSWIGPKGKASRLYDYGVYGITTAITTSATAAIGSPSDADAYGEEFSVVAADNHAISVRQTFGQYDSVNLALYLLTAGQQIAADAEVVYTATAGGAGVAVPFMILDYDW